MWGNICISVEYLISTLSYLRDAGFIYPKTTLHIIFSYFPVMPWRQLWGYSEELAHAGSNLVKMYRVKAKQEASKVH